MSVLTIHNLTYHIGDKTLYQQASFRLNAGEHVCLTGHNGAGKSTLLQLIQGERLPDAGDILWQPGIKAGYLDQHAAQCGHLTLRGYLQSVFADLYEAEAEMLALYADPGLGRPTCRRTWRVRAFTGWIRVSTRWRPASA